MKNERTRSYVAFRLAHLGNGLCVWTRTDRTREFVPASLQHSITSMPVSVAFSNAPIERNALGRSASSEHYLNGQPASNAQVMRARQQAEQCQQMPTAGGHRQYWKDQPVGGRPGSAVCAPAAPTSVTQQPQQNPLIGPCGVGATGFPSKRIIGGSVPAGSSVVQSVVFGRDGHVGVASDVSHLPQFRGAAGVPNGADGKDAAAPQGRMLPRPASLASGSGAGMQTVEHAYHATSYYDGGPKGRRTVGDRPGQEQALSRAQQATTSARPLHCRPIYAASLLGAAGGSIGHTTRCRRTTSPRRKPPPLGHAERRHVPAPSGPASLRGPLVKTRGQPGIW